MRFDERLKKKEVDSLWEEYCGFLDLELADVMRIQKRLLLEQIQLLGQSRLGKKYLKDGIYRPLKNLENMFRLQRMKIMRIHY